MTFSTDVWDRNAALYETIRTMPFNAELAAGTLRRDRFDQYVIQDAHYLLAFGRALALAAAKADTPDAVVQFAEGAKSAVVVERILHNGFMAQFGITKERFDATPLSPACHHYVSFLQSTAWSAPLPVVLAALLPCFWIYAEIGKDIVGRSAPKNPYQPWIDTYSGEEFTNAVKAMIATVDRVAAGQTEDIKAQMHFAYTRAAQLEWMFWDSAYRLENWPV
jgi:thiaminase (transcriptional activator TenA)